MDERIAVVKKLGWFTRLPLWARIIFVLVWPVSVIYGLFWMWKDKKFSLLARISLSILGVCLFVFAAAVQSPTNNTTVPTASMPASVAPTATAPVPEPAAAPRETTSPAPKLEAPAQEAPPIPYLVVADTLVNKRYHNLVVVISPRYVNDKGLRALGSDFFKLTDTTVVDVYDNERAAKMNDAAEAMTLSDKDSAFSDQHWIGSFVHLAGEARAHFGFTVTGDGPNGKITLAEY
jgi:hypothetical protein